MYELNSKHIELVSGGGDVIDAAEGATTGAGAGATVVGIAVAVGATVTAPVVIGVVAAGALIGAAYEYFSE